MITRKLAEFVSQASYQDIPQRVIEHSKILVLDWLGVTLAGSRERIGKILFDFIKESVCY